MLTTACVGSGLAGLIAFCELINEQLQPFERRIARAHFGAQREVVAVLPRGNLKTTLAAKIALHHGPVVRKLSPGAK